MLYVLDTNTISYALRGDPKVGPCLLAQDPADVAVPTVVLYELRYGLERSPAGAAGRRLAALSALVAPMRILEFDARCAEEAGKLRARLESVGTPIGPYDILIAATALANQGTLVTNNVEEFARVAGLQIEDWKTSQRG